MASDPAFLLYYKDILTSCADWDPDAFGWYFKLLCHQADKPEGLPNDIESLATLANVKFSQYDRFKACWDARIKSQFISNRDGLLVNVRMKEGLDKRRNYIDAQTIKGIVGAFIKKVRGLHEFNEKQWKEVSKYCIQNFDLDAFEANDQVYLEGLVNSIATSLASSPAKSLADNSASSLATSIYANGNVIGNEDSDEIDSGKYENHFHGNVPIDLRTYASTLPESRKFMKADDWQKVVQADIRAMGYKVNREVEVPEYKGKKRLKERCLDLVAARGFVVVAIELDNRSINPVSLLKIETYEIGMVLLRNPKTVHIAATVDPKPMVSTSTYPDKSEIEQEIFNDFKLMGKFKTENPKLDVRKLWKDCWDWYIVKPSHPVHAWEWKQKLMTFFNNANTRPSERPPNNVSAKDLGVDNLD